MPTRRCSGWASTRCCCRGCSAGCARTACSRCRCRATSRRPRTPCCARPPAAGRGRIVSPESWSGRRSPRPQWYYDLLAPHAGGAGHLGDGVPARAGGRRPGAELDPRHGAAPDHAGAGRRRSSPRSKPPTRPVCARPIPGAPTAARCSPSGVCSSSPGGAHERAGPGGACRLERASRQALDGAGSAAPGGGYLALPPAPVGALEDFWSRLEVTAP